LAEREGFEPSVRLLTPHSLSRRAPSANSAISPHIGFTFHRRVLSEASPQTDEAFARDGYSPQGDIYSVLRRQADL
jgi:hypothetical protein